MAFTGITQYSELKAGIADYLDRTDLTNQIPGFITQAQAKMYRGERSLEPPFRWVRKPLRLNQMLTTGSLTPSSGSADLSTLTRYIALERIYSNESTGVPLQYLPPQVFWSLEAAYLSGPPKFYTIEGNTLYIGPKNTTALALAYYQTFAALSADVDVDWVLTNAPHVYLHGALMESYDFIGDDQLEARHHAMFNAGINGLDASDEEDAASGSPLIMRPPMVV